MMNRINWKFAASSLMAFTLAGCISDDMSDLRGQVQEIKQSTQGGALEPIPQLEPYVPHAYAAYSLRNPFEQAPFLIEQPEVADSGIRPNLDRAKELLEEFNIESLKLVGTIDKEGLWGLIKAPDGVVHRVGVGNYMGTNHGHIIAVSDLRIDLIEIVSDGIGGWKEREAYLPLSD